jgi:DNA-binding SARP family transcriptional activator
MVTISDKENVVALPSSKPTMLLTAMLLHPNEVVSSEFLQYAVWGETPPEAARATLQTYVLRLRRLFAKFGISNDAISTMPGGYRVPVTEQTLDLVRFRSLLHASERADDPQAEAEMLRSALELWRGAPLSNIQSEVLHRDEVPRLTEDWLRATERRFQLELSLGRCRQVLADLRAVVRSHPNHERFAELLIEALYRVGRQSEALAEYRAIRQYLAVELGVDPCASLQRLELAMLRGEDLGADVPAAARPTVVVLDHPLPGDLPDFTGRVKDTETLVGRLAAEQSGPAISIVSGPPGIGKTVLAVHVAHLVRESFPGGVSFVSMTDGSTVDVPRPGTSGERSLLVVDGVSDAAQVRGLLPTTNTGTVLITSRRSLAELATTRGASIHRIGPLETVESRAMLAAVVGWSKVNAEPAAADELAEVCGHFPLSLRIAATRLLLRPRQSITDGVRWLRADPAGRLSLSGDPGMSIAAMFESFLGEFDPRLVEAFGVIGGRGDAALSLDECADVLHTSPDDAAVVLDRLIDVNLIDSDEGGAYQVPSLLRAFARTRLGPERNPDLDPDRLPVS